MSQETSTPPFHGRGTASSFTSLLQSVENFHGRDVVGKEEQPEKLRQEASKEELEAEEQKAKSLPQNVEQIPSAINPTMKNQQNASSSAFIRREASFSFGLLTSSDDDASNNSDEDEDMETDYFDSGYDPSPDDFLKGKVLTMKDSASPLLSPTPMKKQFKNSVDEDESESKKMKMKMKEKVLGEDGDGNPRNDPKKQLFFQRLSSDKDGEIAILEGNDTHYFIEKANVSMVDKIKELKEKCEKILGEKLKLKTICGAENGIKHVDDQNNFNSAEKKGLKAGQGPDLSMYPYLKESLQFAKDLNASMGALQEKMVKEGLALMGSSKMEELDGKWKRLYLDEIEINLKRVDLIREQMKLLLDAVKKSSSLLN